MFTDNYSIRNQTIWNEFHSIKDDHPSPAAAHETIAQKYGISGSRVRHIISDLRKIHLEPNPQNQSKEPLPREAIPDGYTVKRQSTLINEEGDTEKQWLTSTVQSKRTADIQDAIPKGHQLKQVSTYIDEQGNIRGQWIKTDREQQQWFEIMNSVLEKIPSLIKPLPPVSKTNSHSNDLMALYPLADLHVGLYASIQESERDWGISDAVTLIKNCVDDLIARTPKTSRAVVANLGDFTHIDNLVNRTPNKGTPLDASGRFIEIAQAAMEVAIYVINAAARHHEDVTVIWQSGNHDEATALVLQTALATIYRDDDRVHVHQSGRRTHCIRHGQVAIGFTHGDTIKAQALPLLMANDYPDVWANTRYRVWHCGHLHHKNAVEYTGCFVETHQSPTPRDAWHEQRGYRSLHSMCSIVYDTIGEYTRNTVQVRVPDRRAHSGRKAGR